MKNPCRECTFLRSEEAFRVRRWILGDTKIGLVLYVKVCFHRKRYGIEIMVESVFRDRTVRILNGIDTYVTRTNPTKRQMKYVETPLVTPHQTKPSVQPGTTILIQVTLIMLVLLDSGAMLYIFEDNEAVIEMIIKVRSPTMRHVSRTQRVALDCCVTQSIWIPRFESSMSASDTNSQTFEQKETSLLMSGTIFFICVTTPISANFAALRISF